MRELALAATVAATSLLSAAVPAIAQEGSHVGPDGLGTPRYYYSPYSGYYHSPYGSENYSPYGGYYHSPYGSQYGG